MSTVRIDLNSLDLNFNGGENIKIKLPQGLVRSNFDNSLSDSITYPYTVSSTGPTLIDTTPDLGQTNSYVATVEFVFDDRIRVESGNFYLYKDTNPDTLIATIPYNDLRINVTDDGRIRVDVSGYLDSQTTYYVISDSGIIENHLGIGTGITSEDIVKWTTGQVDPAPIEAEATFTVRDDVVNHLVPRTYLTNQRNNIFATNPIQIDYNGSDALTATYTVTFESSLCEFWNYGIQPTSSLSLTGSKTYINGIISDYGYYPVKNSTATDTITVSLYKGSYLLEKFDIEVTNAGAGSLTNNFTFTGNTSQQWDYAYEKYFSNMSVLIVGGGGGATRNGGGGGQVEVQTLNTASTIDPNQSYSIVVGNGGNGGSGSSISNSNYGTSGGSSSIFGYTALGGSGANFTSSGSTPGRSGSRSVFMGYYDVTDISPNWNGTAWLEGELRVGGSGGGAGGSAANLSSKLYTFTNGGYTYNSYLVGKVIGWEGYTGYGNYNSLMASGNSWGVRDPDTTQLGVAQWGGPGVTWAYGGTYGAGGMGVTLMDLDGSQSIPNAAGSYGGVNIILPGHWKSGALGSYGDGGNGNIIYSTGKVVDVTSSWNYQGQGGGNGGPGKSGVVKIQFYN